MSFPDIPGVEFKFIPNHKSGKSYYAISNDSRVWIGSGNKWNPVKPYEFRPGKWAVMLNYGQRLDGGEMRFIDDLIHEAFGNSND